MMKIMLFSLATYLTLTGCSPQSQSSRSSQPLTNSNLSRDFANEFDRLFLSQEPLRYQDNVAFLDSIKDTELTPSDRELVRAKLKSFLSMKVKNRPYTPDSHITGVASPIAFLRLQSIRLLSEVGMKEDIEFIRNIHENPEQEHPLFEEECKKSIQRLKNR